jgi:hypothetical protein
MFFREPDPYQFTHSQSFAALTLSPAAARALAQHRAGLRFCWDAVQMITPCNRLPTADECAVARSPSVPISRIKGAS